MRFPAIPTTATPFSVNVPLIITSDPNERVAAALSVKAPPAFIVTAPVNVFVLVALFIVNVPLVPFPIVVVPVTVNALPPLVNEPPSLMIRVPLSVETALPELFQTPPLLNVIF